MHDSSQKWILISTAQQRLYCFEYHALYMMYPVSTAKKGLGEKKGSQCTPRGWHQIYRIIGRDTPPYSIFINRRWNGQCYNTMSTCIKEQDYILSRLLWLDGLEEGFNRGGEVDTRSRYIYIHGTQEPMLHPLPLSHGCIRMRNKDVIALADWVIPRLRVYISP